MQILYRPVKELLAYNNNKYKMQILYRPVKELWA
jgi:hypothetical protein